MDTKKLADAFDGAPVIEVSGRLFPVEVRYRALDELMDEDEELSYVDGAVKAVVELLDESSDGDVLLFMPGERDIRETRDLLEGRQLRGVEVLALFSGLAYTEQQRVFAPGRARRVIVSTNVAETSLTIPRIRYVVDTGVARINRYSPRTRTRRLPIEAISRSSAEQRRGRCGRVRDGVCVHLYSEEDFNSRAPYTQPEIQRCDLAEVILRMGDLNLGSIESFPFIDPPAAAAISAGYQQLQELGALDAERRVTKIGRQMAHLPIAPTVSRMILQAQHENVVRQVLVIAAAISIQDPRERPLDRQEAADRSHRQFADPESDFLSLLRIWDAYHEQLDQLVTQSKMRRFCRDHFLSFARMREWRDIHSQLSESVRSTGSRPQSRDLNAYDAIHRSIVSGLLGNVARKKEYNLYDAARGRKVMLFPGSGLFQRQPRKDNPGKSEETGESTGRSPTWIVAAEVVETSRLFARCVARVQPGWLLEMGAHLCRSSYGEPYWSRRAGRVLARETVRLHGLVVITREVGYSTVDAAAATSVFLRQALAADDIDAPYRFVQHNRELQDRIEVWQTRMRSRHGGDLEMSAFQFYRARIDNCASGHDLNRLIRDNGGSDQFLFMSEGDFLDDAQSAIDRKAFPESLTIDGHEARLAYSYSPGDEVDGVTLRVPHTLVDGLRSEFLEWLVPGLIEEKIICLLRSLPKQIRKGLLPIPQTARTIVSSLTLTHASLLESLEACIRERFRVGVRRSDWKVDSLPAHLVMRVEVCDDQGNAIVSGRDLTEIESRLTAHQTPAELEAWTRVSGEWDREGIVAWDLGDLPDRVEVTRVGGVPLYGYPGLEPGAAAPAIRLFRERSDAESISRRGLVQLYGLAMKQDLAWLRGELEVLRQRGDLYSPANTHVRDDAFDCIARHLFNSDPILPLPAEHFEDRRRYALEHLGALASRCVAVVDDILSARVQIARNPFQYDGQAEDLQRLLPECFLRSIPFARLDDLHRYLRAVLIRIERARLDPAKDTAKAAEVQEFATPLAGLMSKYMASSGKRRQLVDEFARMVEEWRVSLFAQELGTSMPVSAKRLRMKLSEIEAVDS